MEQTGKASSATNEGFEHEMNFWREFVKTERFLKGWCSNEKTPELHNMVHDFIVAQKKYDYIATTLDVGSGPVSILHGTADLVISADPLAEFYATIFDYGAHASIVPPLPISAEHVQGSHDIVHCSNALDHTQDANEAYRSMWRAVKPGGYLIIQGFENEGKFENYAGLHQWNISITKNKALRIEFRDGSATEYPSNPETDAVARVKLSTGKDWFIWIVKKPAA